MKEEVFRLEQVSLPPYLHDINIHLFKGEIVGLIGLNALGIEQLLTIFQKNISLHYGHVYCKDELVNDYLSSNHKQNNITVIERKSMLIDTLSVEENLFILKKGCKQHLIRYSLLSNQMQQLLAPLHLKLANKTLVAELTSFEKLVIQFIKAQLSRSSMVILKDISTFVSEIDLAKLKPILDYFSANGMTFLYVCNHHQEAFHFSNRCYLMREGKIIKHLYPDQMNDTIISQYSYEFKESIEEGSRQDQYSKPPLSSRDLVCSNLWYHDIKQLNIELHAGETVVLLASENMILDQLFVLLSGVDVADSGSLLIHGKRPSLADRSIALVPEKPDQSLIFPQLSVMDNLLFTSDHKVPHLWLNRKRRAALGYELQKRFGNRLTDKVPSDFPQSYRLRLVYQRILLQKPTFLCAVQPFASIDMYQRMELISTYDVLKQRGTTILILAVSLSDTLQIADRLLLCKNGQIERQLLRHEFSQYNGIVGSRPT
ncbi:ATP-binding cassette domain-containing protein [Sphaerochaeta halotolerans]|uniref:ATP-binding cassette domain-containing protein n=1 Tax=Sphaerochaeta halotolerans TaxID=2293840 RepID=UPI00136E58AD|nr:ATP-binding cassette domain-containing protein [Sphaerochaeta halotolerans]MXI85772.1 ATP-binding cassette domain-containing protein [Sphaerochaeta halotolerans]